MMDKASATWHREATERGINFIVLIYSKAEGFVFCPTNWEYPFRLQGDYDGSLPTTAEGALSYWHEALHPAYGDRVAWFIPFLEKIVKGEDFSLDELDLDNRSVRLIKGKWPW
jgi:hypothetical protein